jgi:CheY-like chemotaxis protein
MIVGEGGITGHCLVEDLSGGGARVSGGPDLIVGEMVRLLLQLPGRGPFSMPGRVVRRFSESRPGSGEGRAFGISFTRVSEPAFATHEATVRALKDYGALTEPVVLVVDESTQACFTLVQALHQVGRKAIAVTTPLDAIEWLLDGGSHFEMALVNTAHDRGGNDGRDLLAFLADEYPEVRRVLISDSMRMGQLDQLRELTQPHAVLAKPLSVEQLARLFV